MFEPPDVPSNFTLFAHNAGGSGLNTDLATGSHVLHSAVHAQLLGKVITAKI